NRTPSGSAFRLPASAAPRRLAPDAATPGEADCKGSETTSLRCMVYPRGVASSDGFHVTDASDIWCRLASWIDGGGFLRCIGLRRLIRPWSVHSNLGSWDRRCRKYRRQPRSRPP